jgi:hypothetical protein
MEHANNIAWLIVFPILVLFLVISASCQPGL